MGKELFRILLVFVMQTPTVKACSSDDLETCIELLSLIRPSKQESLVVVHDEAELDEVCQHLEESLICLRNISATCPRTAVEDEVYFIYSQEVEFFIRDLCSGQTDFRDQFFSGIECFENVQNDFVRCTQEYNKLIKKAERRRKKKEVFRLKCCYHEEYNNCTRNVISAGCDDALVGVAERLISYSVGHCPDNPSCSSRGSNLLSANVILSPILLVAMTMVYHILSARQTVLPSSD